MPDISRRDFVVAGVGSLLASSPAFASPTVSIATFGAKIGQDITVPLRAAIASLRQSGGVVEIPESKDGWIVSDEIVIDSSNITIAVKANIKLISAKKSSVFVFRGQPGRPINNVGIVGYGDTVTIDGNGRSFPSYIYNTKDTFYSCVLFLFCSDWIAQNIYAYNGLVNCIRAFKCGAGRMIDCSSSHAVFDNGQSVDLDPFGEWSDNDSTTWSQAQIIRPKSWSCKSGTGATSYAATGVQIIDAQVWNCGNDENLPVAGGGISAEGDYFTALHPLRNLRTKIIRPIVHDCMNFGIIVTARGVEVIDPNIYNIHAGTHRHQPPGVSGNAIYALSAATVKISGGNISNTESNAIFARGSRTYVPTVEYDGVIDGPRNGGSGAMQGGVVKLSPTTRVTNIRH